MITRQDHAIVCRWDAAEAFGATGPDQNPTAAGVFVYGQRFPGQVFDQETGLFQMYWVGIFVRWYAPARDMSEPEVKAFLNAQPSGAGIRGAASRMGPRTLHAQD